MKDDPIIGRSESQKLLRIEKLRAELKELLRQSVPTEEAPAYWNLGWVYIMPDFDKPNHSIVEWQGEKLPVYPREDSHIGQPKRDLVALSTKGERNG